MLRDAVIKLARQSSNGRFVPDVRRAKSTRCEAAEKSPGFNKDRRLAHFCSLHCGDDSRRSPAENANVRLDDFST